MIRAAAPPLRTGTHRAIPRLAVGARRRRATRGCHRADSGIRPCQSQLSTPFYLREDISEMRLRKLFMAFTLTLATTGVTSRANPHAAVASCAVVPSVSRGLATAPVVFVGNVVATRNHSRTAVVRLQDVWRGNHVPKIAIVNNNSGFFQIPSRTSLHTGTTPVAPHGGTPPRWQSTGPSMPTAYEPQQ